MRILLLLITMMITTALSAQTTIPGSIQSGGLTRDYLLYVPALYTGTTAVPLVINLHGYTSSNLEQAFYGDFRSIADTANFLIVHPNGTLDGQGNRFWNTFGGASTVDDVGFIADLIISLQATYNLDANRIYATGMSNGGFMSYALACELNDRIAAIASVTGSMITPELAACDPARPVPVMEIHGTADATVPYTGGTLLGFVPIPTLVAAWAGFNHCNPTPTITQVPNTNTTDGCTAEHAVYTGGDLGSTVEHYKVIGGAHTWPGSAFIIGVTNQDFSASREIWRFFSQYKLDQLTATQTSGSGVYGWSVFPNPLGDYVMLQASASLPVAEHVQVYDSIGRLIEMRKQVQSNTRLETGDWKDGLYLIVITGNGKTERLTVVKKSR